jgi:hypothetical protein
VDGDGRLTGTFDRVGEIVGEAEQNTLCLGRKRCHDEDTSCECGKPLLLVCGQYAPRLIRSVSAVWATIHPEKWVGRGGEIERRGHREHRERREEKNSAPSVSSVFSVFSVSSALRVFLALAGGG